MPRVGIRPSYGDDKDGVLLDGVTEGTPADRAGLKGGDRIVEVAGQPVKNLELYMTILAAAAEKKGQPVEFGVLRGGKKLTIKLIPE
jgi:S1-C subfamily serine protease